MAATAARRAQVLAVLAANGGNVARTARDTKTARATVQKWRDEHAAATAGDQGPGTETADGPEVLPDTLAGEAAQVLPDVMATLEAGLGTVLKGLLEELGSPARVEKFRLEPTKDLLTGAGIVTDKLLLLAGKPTGRVENLNRDMLSEELNGLLAANDPADQAG